VEISVGRTEEDDAMTIDRRELVRLGALDPSVSSRILSVFMSVVLVAAHRPAVQIKGLCIIERLGHAVTVHMSTRRAVITSRSSSTSVHLGSDRRRRDHETTAASIVDPADLSRTAYRSRDSRSIRATAARRTLTMNDDDVHMLASIPANDDDWKSVNLGASCRRCAARRRSRRAVFVCGARGADHGFLRAVKPEGDVGIKTVWKFTKAGTAQPVANQR